MVAPYDPLEMGTGGSFAPPDAEHLFGTDLFGRDIFSRTVHGARVSLAVAFAAVLFSSLDRRHPGADGRLLWRLAGDA